MNQYFVDDAHADDVFIRSENNSCLLPPDPDFFQECESRVGDKVYTEFLVRLTRMEFSPCDAKKHWQGILETHEKLSDLLQVEVDIRTAACEYMTRNRLMADPLLVESRIVRHTEKLALQDELTGLYNRRFFNNELPKEIERSKRSGEPLSLLMLDVDFFKDFNDSYGHLAGDKALAKLSQILCDNARLGDQIVRYGGEEFAMLLPQADKDRAYLVAERHRLAVADNTFDTGKGNAVKLSVSIGIASYPEDTVQEEELILTADRALYRAKQNGRNIVCSDPDDNRIHPRFPISMPLCWQWNELSGNGRTLNLSMNGLLCESAQPVLVGRKVKVVLSDPDSNFILPLDAKSVRMFKDKSTPGVYFMGMKFMPNSSERDLLEALFSETSRAVQ